MPAAPRTLAWTFAVLAALAAGTAAAARVAPIEPSLDVEVHEIATSGNLQVMEVRATPRGGETIAVVRMEVLHGLVAVKGRKLLFNVAPDTAARYELLIHRDSPEDVVLRIHQEGRVSRAYDLTIPVDRP